MNGLRAAVGKGFGEHLEALGPDVLLLQEVRARPGQLPGAWSAPPAWHALWHPAEQPGYAGVAVWSRTPAEILETGLGTADPEGRVLRVRVGWLQVVSLYVPSGSSGELRQATKEAFMAELLAWTRPLAALDEPVVIGGDFNVAPTPDDLFNPTGNKKNSGFLPHEREWFAELLESGWTDLFRAHRGPGKGPWSWWSNRGKARELDRGWRIDFLLGNAAAAARLERAHIRKEAGITVSDHAPVTVDLRRRV
ncbi:MAG: endonuclease/exonuclease/phosphatase family protein [Alphaproteobacteria bacterium]|nr:endonuclease/exonuclease/phosphatase family protein [Alphaproteobacteria bacterium]